MNCYQIKILSNLSSFYNFVADLLWPQHGPEIIHLVIQNHHLKMSLTIPLKVTQTVVAAKVVEATAEIVLLPVQVNLGGLHVI